VPKTGKFVFLFKRAGARVIIDKRGTLVVRPSPLELNLQPGEGLRAHLLFNCKAAGVPVFSKLCIAEATCSACTLDSLCGLPTVDDESVDN
jgi:hypothetical protein